MSATVVSLDALLVGRQVWKGRAGPEHNHDRPLQPTGHTQLDHLLPTGGWPPSALSEILLPAQGCGELRLLWPTLARLTAAAQRVVLVAPPYIPYPHAWQAAGVDLAWLTLVRAQGADALWAAEQCLRSGSCAAVVCWPCLEGGGVMDDRALRRLQVAAEAGQALGFVIRPHTAVLNPSPAALRIAVSVEPSGWRVLKCRGGQVSGRLVASPAFA